MAIEPETYGAWEDLSTEIGGMIGYKRMALHAHHLTEYWRRCSLSSDFWARYTALSSSSFSVDKALRVDAVESVLSYLLNELFENCAKFSRGPIDDVVYQAWLFPERMAFQMTNHIDPGFQDGFTHMIEELMSSDLEKLYFKRLEENAENNERGSGLGYLTLMKDYNVRFGFRFTPIVEGSIAVDVQAHINVKEI